MGVVKRFNELQNLENIEVLVDEFGESRYITISDFPDTFPQGKSSFLIEVSPYLKLGVELQIDIFDSEGSSIGGIISGAFSGVKSIITAPFKLAKGVLSKIPLIGRVFGGGGDGEGIDIGSVVSSG